MAAFPITALPGIAGTRWRRHGFVARRRCLEALPAIALDSDLRCVAAPAWVGLDLQLIGSRLIWGRLRQHVAGRAKNACGGSRQKQDFPDISLHNVVLVISSNWVLAIKRATAATGHASDVISVTGCYFFNNFWHRIVQTLLPGFLVPQKK
jgi:hypothetical protein